MRHARPDMGGPTYYQRLKQMPMDKYSRDGRGDVADAGRKGPGEAVRGAAAVLKMPNNKMIGIEPCGTTIIGIYWH